MFFFLTSPVVQGLEKNNRGKGNYWKKNWKIYFFFPRTKLWPFSSPDNKYGPWITLPFQHRPLWMASQHVYAKEPFLCATSSPEYLMAVCLKQQMKEISWTKYSCFLHSHCTNPAGGPSISLAIAWLQDKIHWTENSINHIKSMTAFSNTTKHLSLSIGLAYLKGIGPVSPM